MRNIKYIFILILFLLNITLLQAQRKKKFSNSSKEFKRELMKIIKEPQNKDIQSFFQVIDNYEDLKELIINFNLFKKYKFSKKEYLSYIRALLVINKIGKLKSFLNHNTVNVQSKRKLRGYVKVLDNFLTKNILYEKRDDFSWIYKGKMEYVVDNSLVKIKIKAETLVCKSKRGSIMLYGVEGVFIPAQNKIIVNKGLFYWNASKKKKHTYAQIKEMTIDLTKKYFKADNVILNNAMQFEDMAGSLEMRLTSSKRTIYPLFRSDESREPFSVDLSEGVNYYGYIVLQNEKILGVSEKTGNSIVTFFDKGKKLFVITSKKINISKKRIYASNAKFDLFLNEKVISHTAMGVEYDLKKDILRLQRNTSTLSKSPMTNAYHNVNMNVVSIEWNKPKHQITIKGDAQNTILLSSVNYYDKKMFSQFDNLDGTNLLKKLHKMIQANPEFKNRFSFDFISSYLNAPKVNIINSIINISLMGVLDIDMNKELVIFTEPFFNLIKANDLNNDHDEIIFVSGKKNIFESTINLNDKDKKMFVNYINHIQLSNKQYIYMFPNGKIVVKNGFDFSFDGQLKTKLLYFEDAKGVDFSYDKYKINFGNVKRVGFNLKSENLKLYLENVKAEIFVDKPDNKSNRKNNPKYPIFRSIGDSYIYYDDKKIQNGVYPRSEFYAQILPLEIDSLNTVDANSLLLKGKMVSAGIFKDFNQTFMPQKDGSIGFVKTIPNKGFKMYGGKGIFKNRITLNMKGLTGQGNFTVFNAKMKSEDVIFFPDSLKSKQTEFKLDKGSKKTYYPNVESESVNVHWSTNKNILTAKSINDFIMYNHKTKLKGKINLSSDKLEGAGKLSLFNSIFESEKYRFSPIEFKAQKMDMIMYDSAKLKEIQVKNIRGVFSFKERQGDFRLNNSKNYLNLEKYMYYVNLDKIRWDQKNSMLYLTKANKNIISWFRSKKDSLEFTATESEVHLKENNMKVNGVDNLKILDASITPDKRILTIVKGGKIDTLRNAKISINNDFHMITNATVAIFGKHRYWAKGKYSYIDKDKITYIIDLSRIVIDNGSSIAQAQIPENEVLPLSPYFDYYGKLTLTGKEKFLKYKGSVKLNHHCNLNIPSVRIATYIDPKDIRLKFQKPLLNGIYYSMNKFLPAFLSIRKIDDTNKLITTDGELRYNEKIDAYQFQTFRDNNLLSEVSFYKDRCVIEGKGGLNFGIVDTTIVVNTFGTAKYNLQNNDIDLNIDLGFKFFMHEDLSNKIAKEVNSSDDFIENVIYKTHLNEELMVNKLFTQKEKEEYIQGKNLGKVPEKMKYILSFKDIDFKWDKKESSFISEGKKINVNQINEVQINRKLPGVIKILKKGKKTVVQVYFQTDASTYYYFEYDKHVIKFFTNHKAVLNIFNKIEEEDRIKQINDTEYMYIKASSIKIKKMQNIFRKKQKQKDKKKPKKVKK